MAEGQPSAPISDLHDNVTSVPYANYGNCDFISY